MNRMLIASLIALATCSLERFRLVRSTVAVVLLPANGGGDGAVFDGSAEAGCAGVGCER